MFKRFIDNPVLSTVISIIIVILGILGIFWLPMEQYPDIAPPTVRVSASYSGANAETVLKSVVIPLENQINGVEGMTYMTSEATNDGDATITIYFSVGTDPDQAAVNVQNRVSWASSLLPSEVTQAGVTTKKQQTGNLLIVALYSDSDQYDEAFLQNYSEINIVPQMKRIDGVGEAAAFGSKTYSMRIWLKPDIMSQYNITVDDITSALSDQNVEAAPGKFGENGNQSFQYTIRYKGTLSEISDYEKIIIKADSEGHFIRLKDVAKIGLGTQSYSSLATLNGHPAANIAVNQVAGSNAQEIIKNAKEVLNSASIKFPKGIKLAYLVDINNFLDASISKVIHTLIEAFILVFIVVLIFLQDFRSTLIPAIAVPVAITGTFFFLYLFDYSINMLTLFALVLAIGIVVDDAIVVVEAVHAKLDEGYKSAKKASVDAMNEISSAIISITLVMAAVFIPVAFVGGSSGVFYKQFGITLAIAIVISAINALTLSPALTAIFLKPRKKGEKQQSKQSLTKRFKTAFNTTFEKATKRYTHSVRFLSHRKWLSFGILVFFCALLLFLVKTSSSSFVPDEDMGTIFVNITMPPATSLEKTDEVAKKIEKTIRAIPGVEYDFKMVGQNFMAGSGSSYAMIITSLKNWDDRKDISQQDVIDEIMKRTAFIKEASITAFAQPAIMGFGATTGVSVELQDKESHTTEEFYNVVQSFTKELSKEPEIQLATTSFNPNYPQYMMDVNIEKVKQSGITLSGILTTMQVYFGSYYVNNFTKYGKQYRVIIQAEPKYRSNIDQLNKVFVQTADGTQAPITEFITMKRIYGPESRTRFNLYNSISVMASVNKGYSNGQALEAVQRVADKLPSGYSFEYSGMSREESGSGTTTIFVFGLCLVFVYLILSALYASYILPLAVILSIPIGLSGTFLLNRIAGIDNNIYAQISLIMLIGLLAKNAILIVEYALDRRKQGMPIVNAAVNGAKARLRPILMTSFAFILGLLPLMFSSGVGVNGNRSIGTSAIGGMLFGTVFAIFIIPVLFVIFQTLQEKISSRISTEED
ncbi:MAG: efflux system, inner rane transporter CmeB [Bacteroidetes bacterium]|nr:efflux system, inner rane transporter CmeB [Bacteroidota bacterium]